jgi:hypothetical protein
MVDACHAEIMFCLKPLAHVHDFIRSTSPYFDSGADKSPDEASRLGLPHTGSSSQITYKQIRTLLPARLHESNSEKVRQEAPLDMLY